jgi:DNA repair exonuclease SbcCD ATPase subunit
LNEALETITDEYRIISEELSALKSEEAELNDGVIENTSKLVTLADSVRLLDDILSEKIDEDGKLITLNETSTLLSEKLGKYTALKSDIDNLIQTHFSDISIRYDEYNKLLNSKRELTHSLEKLELRQKSLDTSLLHLSEHEYNPDCSICLKNSESVIKNKENAQHELSKIRNDVEKTTQLLNSVESEISELSWVVRRWDEYTSTMEKKRKLDSAISDTERELTSTDGSIFRVKTKLEKLEEDISDCYRFENDFKSNIELNKIIGELKSKLNIVRSRISDTDKRLLGKNGEQSSVQKEIQLLTDKIEEVRKLEAEHKSYEYYLDAVKRDGISYELISKIIPIIEGEVNNILAQMVEFGMQLEMDGKNINAYIVYADQQWPLEMSSGMERFISGLAIRVALINVCNLPRPNFLVVDEGFGSLDSENMTSMFMMFNYLKTQFDFVMVISHIDSMRDIVDQLIEIKKTNGFSYLKF